MTLLHTRLGDALAALAASPSATQEQIDAAKTKWRDLAKEILDEFIENGVITSNIQALTINTAGTAAAQVGPPSPVPVTGSIL